MFNVSVSRLSISSPVFLVVVNTSEPKIVGGMIAIIRRSKIIFAEIFIRF